MNFDLFVIRKNCAALRMLIVAHAVVAAVTVHAVWKKVNVAAVVVPVVRTAKNVPAARAVSLVTSSLVAIRKQHAVPTKTNVASAVALVETVNAAVKREYAAVVAVIARVVKPARDVKPNVVFQKWAQVAYVVINVKAVHAVILAKIVLAAS